MRIFTRQKLLLLIATLSILVGSCSRENPAEGAFVVLLDAAPKGLDPRFATNDSSAKIVGLLHAGLLSTDTATGAPELRLAKSIDEVSPTLYRVELRSDAVFHNGDPVESEDVRYTYMEMGSELVKSPFAGMSKKIKEFRILGKKSFEIELNEPDAPFYSDLGLGIVNSRICAGHSECPGDPIGAGPFKFVAQYGDDVLLEKFDGPKIERLFFKTIKDDNTRLLALLGDAADLVQNAVQPVMLPVVQDAERLEVISAPSFKYTYLAFNLEDQHLKHLKVRQAIALGIDRKSIITYKYRDTARLSTGVLAPNHWAYHGDVETFDFNPERARQLLDEAGFEDPDGDGPLPRFEIEFKVSANKFRVSLAELIAHQLADIGISVKVRSYEWGTFYDDIRSRNFQLTTMQWPSVLEPSILRWIFHSENIPTAENRSAGANRGAYRNPRVDELLDEGNRETKRDKRRQIYAEVQEHLARDLPYVSLWHEDNIAVLKKGTRDYFVTPNARFEGLKVTIPAETHEQRK